MNQPKLLSLIYTCFFFSTLVHAQRGEFFVAVDPPNTSFEIISALENVELVARMRPAFSETLGQYTFIQGLPEIAAITVDIDTGEILYYSPLTNVGMFTVPNYLVRLNDGRVLGLRSYFTEIELTVFDPVEGGEVTVLSTISTNGVGNITLYELGYNPNTHKIYLQYGYDLNNHSSWMVEVDPDSGEVLADFTLDTGFEVMLFHSELNAFIVSYSIGSGWPSPQSLGIFNSETLEVTPLTTPSTLVYFNPGISSLDETNERIYVSYYETMVGSTVAIVDFSVSPPSVSQHLVLESEFAGQDFPPLADTSHNVINCHFSNSRNACYGLHWGEPSSSVFQANSEAVQWQLHALQGGHTYRVIGLDAAQEKSLIVMDTQGRLIHEKQQVGGETIDINLPLTKGIYLVAIIEGRKRQCFKLLRQ